MRISLVDVYNSVFKHDLIGIIETHVDSNIDENKLTLDGYTFMKNITLIIPNVEALVFT